MDDHKLLLLLFFSAVALSKAQDKGAPCLMAKRYKAFNKYEYYYETESLNALNGQINGPKASCKVEITVPDTCSYILRTTDCTLSEVIDVDADGDPVIGEAAAAEDFKANMEKNPLKFTIERDDDIRLFPEEGERTNILNIKRGIISALAVPVLEKKGNRQMPTIYGLCKTEYVVNGRKRFTLNRDLSTCDKFRPIKDHTSPLALITGMHHLLAQLIRSRQNCDYKFSTKHHHLTSVICTEKHLLMPFSHKGEYGVTNTGKQVLTLLDITEYSDRVFDHNVVNMKPLHLDSSVDKCPIQDKEATLAVLRELSKANNGRKRAHLFHKLVAIIRKMESETLRAALPEALEISVFLTYQALIQCGTPECSTALIQFFRTSDASLLDNTVVYAMGMIQQSSRVLVKELLEMAKFKPSKPIYYALSNAVRRLYKTDGVTNEIQAVADYALGQIGDCTGDQEHVFLSLRVVGNMVAALGTARPALHSAVIQCINQPTASPAVQQAAIQVYRQIPVSEKGRGAIIYAALDRSGSVQKRVAAYLILMRSPTLAELAQLATALHVEENNQAKSFITSHISNILSSTAPETLKLRQDILEAFQGKEIGMVIEPTKLSKFYTLGLLEGNVIFESPNELAREVMLEMTLNAFGLDMDLIGFGMEGKGFEPFAEALFGDDGFFPDTAMKIILHATSGMPSQLNEVLDDMMPFMSIDRKYRQAPQNIGEEISHNVNKLLENLKTPETPEAIVYLKLLGADLGYLDTKDAKMIYSLLQRIPFDFPKRLFSSVDNKLFLHYIFMDNEFYLPTGAGFPLRVALSGTFTPGIKGGISSIPNMREFAFMLSADIEFVAEIGTHFPDYIHSGLEMHTNLYHESGLRAKISMTNNQFRLSIPTFNGPTELLSVTNYQLSVVGGKILPISAKGKYINMEKCIPFFPGLKECNTLKYPDVSSEDPAPYFPLTGDSKFAFELHPSGMVSEYAVTISKDEEDNITINAKAEGTPYEAIITVLSNFGQKTASVKLLIEALQLDYKVSAKLEHGSTMKLESNLKLPETTSFQSLVLKYENEKIEAEVRSQVNSEIRKLIPSISAIETMINALLDRQSGQNEMTVRDILAESVEYLGIPVIPRMTLPKRLFLNVDAAVEYHFGGPYYNITLPLSLGGSTTHNTEHMTLPFLDLAFASSGIHNVFFLPVSVTLSLPSLEMADVSGQLSSNFYNLKADMSAARDPAAKRYSVKGEVTGRSPADLLSIKAEGSARVEASSDDSIKAKVQTEVFHKIIRVTFNAEEGVELAEKLKVKSKSKLEITGHFGVQTSLEHTGTIEVNAGEISGDGHLKGSFEAGSIHGLGTLKQSVSLHPSRAEAKIDFSSKVDSTLLQARNSFAVALAEGELLILSNTTAFDDILENIAKITFQDSQLTLYSYSNIFGLKIQNMAETRVGAGVVGVKIETSTYISEHRIHSMITGALDIKGVDIQSDASAELMGHTATHKASLKFSKDGLTSSGTTSLQMVLTKQELKHTFEIIYKHITATVQCKTIGKILGTDIDHNTVVEISGLYGKIKNNLRINSRILKVDINTHGTTIPFDFNFAATANSEDTIYLYGLYKYQFNAKVHFKANPQSITHSYECKIFNLLEIGIIDIESEFESKSDCVLNPSVQKVDYFTKAQLNKHAIEHKINVQNTQAQTELKGSGKVYTNLFNTARTTYQDFVVSGFIKCYKNSDRYSVNLPFIKSLHLVPDNIIKTIEIMDETLRNYINRGRTSFKTQNFSQQVHDFASNLNFETRVGRLRHALIALSQESALNLDSLEALVSETANRCSKALDHLKQWTMKVMLVENVEELLPVHISSFIFSITDNVNVFLNEIFHPAGVERKLDSFFQIPEISLSVPSFDKMYVDFRLNSPVYNVKTLGEFKNASEEYPQFTVVISSQGTAASRKILNYILAHSARISVPETSPATVSGTITLAHSHFVANQEASWILNGFSSNSNVSSFSLETSYKNQVNIPSLSLFAEISLIQKAVAFHDAGITLTVKNEGTNKFVLKDFFDRGTYKSDLHFNMGLSTAKLTLTGHTKSDSLQMNMNVNADAVALSHLKFNVCVDTESPFIKSSVLVASGKAILSDIKVEIKAAHDTELIGAVSGILSNAANIHTFPYEIDIDFKNKANVKIELYESFLRNVYLQNDYAVIFNPDTQEISNVAVAHLNHYIYRHNVTANNNDAEMGIYAVVNSLASFRFLKTAGQYVPDIFKTSTVRYPHSNGNPDLWYALTVNDQPIDLNAKLVYQKYWFAPIVDMGLVPSLGNLVSEVFFKSSILSLNANADIHLKDCLMRVSATTASAHQGLKAKLNGATSLTTTSGVKLVSSFSLENAHIEGNHASAVTLEDNYKVVLVVDTVAKINLTSFTVDATHQLSAGTKAHPKALSNLKIKYTFDHPNSVAAGYGDAENTLKLDGSLSFISIRSSTQLTTNSTLAEDVALEGTLDNEVSIFANAEGLKSNLNITGNGCIDFDYDYDYTYHKLLFDINDQVSLEGDLGRIYSSLDIDSNYRLLSGIEDLAIKHNALGKSDIVPLNTLIAAVDIFLTQISYNDFDVRDEELDFSQNYFLFKSKTFSRWYNSSIFIGAGYFENSPDKRLMYECSYNLTSPSLLMEYKGDLNIIPNKK